MMINKKILNTLLKIVPKNKNIVIANIGTDAVMFDSLAPLIGSYLEEKDINMKIYGTLDRPIHATRIHECFNNLAKNHQDDFVIGIDACNSSKREIGEIFMQNVGVHPGRGVGKELPVIGDISILGVTSQHGYNSLIRLSTIIKMANEIVDTLVEFDRIRKEVSLNEN